MLDEIQNIDCDKCSLAGICQSVCIMGSGNEESKVMFVGEAPTQAEDKQGATFTSVKYDLLWQTLKRILGKNSEDYYYTTLVKCAPGEGRYIESDEITNCREYLDAEIAHVKPTCIISFGAGALEALTGKKGINANRGTVMRYVGDANVTVIPTYSPNYVELKMNSSKSILEQFAKDINKGLLISEGLTEVKELTKTKTCNTIEEVKELIEHVKTTGIAVMDFETEGLDYKIHQPTMLGISFQIGSGWGIPLYHFESPFDIDQVAEIMTLIKVEIWENPAIRKVGQNFKFDLHFANAYTYGGITPVNFEDIINMHHILDENSRHGLKIVGPRYFPQFEGYDDEAGKYKWAEVPLEVLIPYCVCDTDLTFRLLVAYETELLQYPELYRLYRSLSNPTLHWTFEAEKEGMLIDRDYLVGSIDLVTGLIDEKEVFVRACPEVMAYDKYKREQADANLLKTLGEKLERTLAKAKNKESVTILKYQERIRNIKIGNLDKDSFEHINFGSPKQLGELLYEKAGFNFEMPYDKKKRKKVPSTEKKYLEDLKDTSGFIDTLLEWRRMSKLRSTYFTGILDRLDTDNRLHTDFLVFGTTTGRISSRDPNLQNIPRKGNDSISKIASRVKNCFIAPEGYVVSQCVAEGTRVATDKGLIKIENVTTDDKILSQGKYYNISKAFKTGDKPCYKITTITGREIITTDNHKFKTISGFKEVKDFEEGEVLYMDNVAPTLSKEVKCIEQYIAGLIMGDGHYQKNTTSGYVIGLSICSDVPVFRPILDKYFGVHSQLSKKGDYRISNKEWYNYFSTVYPKTGAYGVCVPNRIWGGSKEEQLSFLAGAMDSDGSYHSDRLTISSVCKSYVLELQLLSNSLGYYGIVRREERDTNFKKGAICYHLDIFENASLQGFPTGYVTRKSTRREKGFTQCRTSRVPYQLIHPYRSSGIQKSVLGNRLFSNGRRKNRVTRDAIIKAELESDILNYRYEEVKSIEPAGTLPVYDLTVPEVSLFSANGLVVHNCDYSQAELRLVAEFAREDTMIEAYKNDKDLHALTARTIKGMTEEEFDALEPATRSDERFKAKAANFGLIYGMEAESYQDYKKHDYKILSSFEDCVKERHKFFQLYSKLLKWHKRQMVEGKKFGYVTTLFGRRRRLLDINNPDDFTRSMSERQAINAPIQGSAGEFTVFSGAILSHRLKVYDDRIKLVNTVHDSIIFYIPEDIVGPALELIKDTLENPPVKEYFDLELQYVSMKVDCEVGTSWGTLEEI